ncbi:3-hydroxybutyrate oligomer hydrolase family protein [Zophobihabitans entericus]|uniref:D-(-)-3-hydroxybutyrate oligomer hydrolase n=1 Tax=Zophobihabitans entericus TaxID=1635327 RepID=A0A6G9IAH7_9GAMM|nr:3-hydroxybutyrate oligomer hydrolase family protein [Zophobihabitans entericus]QIQ21235.1 D-(-)-3-hydroxybutyrate oligomer hydrolase [Zophobihabitans entericus]
MSINQKNKRSSLFFAIGAICAGMSFSSITLANNDRPIFQSEAPKNLNVQPAWLILKDRFEYDGDKDDLVTAGYGFSKMVVALPELKFANPLSPTMHERRQLRLGRYINSHLGEGYLYGFRFSGLTPLFDGKVAGTEFLAYQDDGTGTENVAMMLQIPLDFDTQNPCIVAVPASDSTSLYDAKDLQIRGLWGLKKNCAVVYTDKGLGNGFFDITNNKGYLINGQTERADSAQNDLQFKPTLADRNQFIANYPDRFAVKQLHSQQNPEAKWGEYVLKSIEFAFYQINEEFAPTQEIRFNKENTLVIVYGASDGGGAALKAGELDENGLIDGIVAVNPQIQPEHVIPLTLNYQGQNIPLEQRSLIDYATYGNLFMPCATMAVGKNVENRDAPFTEKLFFAKERCQSLYEKGLLTSDTLEGQAKESLDKLHQYGWTTEMDKQLAFQYFTNYSSYAYKYISSLGRYGVEENLCDYSIASVDQERIMHNGKLAPLARGDFESFWSKGNGTIPVIHNIDISAIDLVSNVSEEGPRRELYTMSPSTHRIDYNLDGAICLRDLAMQKSSRVQEGLNQVLSSGYLNHITTFIVHGRDNSQVLPNYSARPYVALNSYVEGSASKLRYFEITNSSYFEAKIPFDDTLLSIDYYGESAADWLWSNLTKGTSLPDSQVVHTVPRGGLRPGFAPAATEKNFTPILQSPRPANLIQVSDGTITIPK